MNWALRLSVMQRSGVSFCLGLKDKKAGDWEGLFGLPSLSVLFFMLQWLEITSNIRCF